MFLTYAKKALLSAIAFSMLMQYPQQAFAMQNPEEDKPAVQSKSKKKRDKQKAKKAALPAASKKEDSDKPSKSGAFIKRTQAEADQVVIQVATRVYNKIAANWTHIDDAPDAKLSVSSHFWRPKTRKKLVDDNGRIVEISLPRIIFTGHLNEISEALDDLINNPATLNSKIALDTVLMHVSRELFGEDAFRLQSIEFSREVLKDAELTSDDYFHELPRQFLIEQQGISAFPASISYITNLKQYRSFKPHGKAEGDDFFCVGPNQYLCFYPGNKKQSPLEEIETYYLQQFVRTDDLLDCKAEYLVIHPKLSKLFLEMPGEFTNRRRTQQQTCNKSLFFDIGGIENYVKRKKNILLRHAALSDQDFKYQREVFTLQKHNFSRSDIPSFESVYEQFQERLKFFDALFEFVNEHKLDASTTKMFHSNIQFLSQICKGSYSDKLLALSSITTDYAAERDLVHFFTRVLDSIVSSARDEKFPSEDVFTELYKQTVYVVRKNVQSLFNDVFMHLLVQYPEYAKREDNGDQQLYSDVSLDSLDPEYRLYYDFLKNFSHSKDSGVVDSVMRRNTFEIEEMAYFLLEGIENLQASKVIASLNSLHTYLNLEKALLSNCSSLEFDPDIYDLSGRTSAQQNAFVLSRVFNTYQDTAMGKLFSEVFDPKREDRLMRLQDSCLAKACAPFKMDPYQSFFEKLFPEKKKAVQAKKKPAKKGAKTNKPFVKKVKKAGPSRPAQPPVPSIPEATVKPTVVDSQVFEKEIETDDKKEDDVVQNNNNNNNNNNNDVPVLRPYVSKVSYKNIAYKKRNTTQRTSPSYVLDGKLYTFQVAPIDVRLLEEIKSLNSDSHGSENLPNLARYRLRFHYTVDGSDVLKMHEVINPRLFLCGKKYFSREFIELKSRHKIIDAFDYLQPHQKKECKSLSSQGPGEDASQKRLSARAQFMESIFAEKCQRRISGGHWKANCLDSEALLLLELTGQIPYYLRDLMAKSDKKITLRNVALCISTYRTCCSNCRLLIQSFQWGLNDLINHHFPESDRIATHEDFSTVAVTIGQVETKFPDLLRPAFDSHVTLGYEGKENTRHKFTSVLKQVPDKK